MNKSRLKIIFFILFFITAITLTTLNLGQAVAAGNFSISFYNPETNINNYASLKTIFDRYFSGFGNYIFQPFSKKTVFENIIAKNKNSGILILSSWHFKSLSKKKHLLPVLISEKNQNYTYKKILLTKESIKSVKELKGKTVASSGSKEYTISLLKEMVDGDMEEVLSSIKILNVPKDIDALFAVGFGVAHAAFTTEQGLNQISQVNPNLKNRLSVLLTSQEILMPVVAIINRNDNNPQQAEIIDILKKMGQTQSGKEKLALLSIDGWRHITPEIMRKLTK